MEDENDLGKAVAVSPADQSSDRHQADEDQKTNTKKLDALLAETLNRAGEAVEALDRFRRNRRTDRLLLAGIGLALVAMAVMMVFVAVSSNDSKDSALAAKSNTAATRALAERLISCTESTGKCYQELQSQGGQESAINTLVQLNILAIACDPNIAELTPSERAATIQSCVKKLAPKPRPSPSPSPR